MITCGDYLEVRLLSRVMEKLDWKKARVKNRKVLKRFVDKKGIGGMKIKELTRKEKDKIAKEVVESAQE